MPIAVEVWGDLAMFTRPEFKVERISYDVITPSAARGILEAIYWHPGVKYVIDHIQVCKPIQTVIQCRNELKDKISFNKMKAAMMINNTIHTNPNTNRTQKSCMYLQDVKYIIHAHIEILPNQKNMYADKALNIFEKRLKKGRCYKTPFLGCRECAAYFEKYEKGYGNFEPPIPEFKGEHDLGWMLYDMAYNNLTNIQPMFFRAIMKDGVISIKKEDVRT